MDAQAHLTLAQMLLARVMTLPVLNRQGGYEQSRQLIKQVPRRLLYRITFPVPAEGSDRATRACSRMGTAENALRRFSASASSRTGPEALS